CTLHKLGFNPLGPKEVRVRERTDFVATFRRLKRVAVSDQLTFRLKEISYYTERDTDLAIFRAEESLGYFLRLGIRPLKLAKRKLTKGSPLRIVGAPLARVSESEHYLRVSDCRAGASVALKNGPYRAPFSVIHQCSSIEGFSGAPLVDPKTLEVYLINSH